MKEFVKKLIGRLEEVKDRYTDDCLVQKMMAMEEAVQIVNQLAEEMENTTWIPCSERLPEDCGDVICTTHLKGYEVNNTMSLWYNAKEREWFSDDKKVNKNLVVIAWMPLPAPYQKGE